jgi:hypothetical protein
MPRRYTARNRILSEIQLLADVLLHLNTQADARHLQRRVHVLVDQATVYLEPTDVAVVKDFMSKAHDQIVRTFGVGAWDEPPRR